MLIIKVWRECSTSRRGEELFNTHPCGALAEAAAGDDRPSQVDPSTSLPNLANLYGCTTGDETTIGPFVEIQRGVRKRNPANITTGID